MSTRNPNDSHGYFVRHIIRKVSGNFHGAIKDCSKAIEIAPKQVSYRARGEVYRALGDHKEALSDFNRARDINYHEWLHSFGPHLRADTLARLGRLDEALADAALIKDDRWMAAYDGLPGGDKQEFIAEIKQRAAAARSH